VFSLPNLRANQLNTQQWEINTGLTTSIKHYLNKNIPTLGMDSLLGSRQQAIARNVAFDEYCYFSLLAFVLFLAYFKD
jgi:hypothetical protein